MVELFFFFLVGYDRIVHGNARHSVHYLLFILTVGICECDVVLGSWVDVVHGLVNAVMWWPQQA